MSGPCSDCGAARLVTVRIPGHDDIEAVLCLACGEPQHPNDTSEAQPLTER